MAEYKIENKLVVAVASSALFDLSESDKVYQEKGLEEYRKYQRYNQDKLLPKGVAFPFIKRFLTLNNVFPGHVEVVLLSKNDPDTGLRVFKSINQYGLSITRASFLNGKSPFKYIPAFNASLFLSANPTDVKNAIDAGYPAGTVLKSNVSDEQGDNELRIAFDFDGVIVDDKSEAVFQSTGDVEKFNEHETENYNKLFDPGPLFELFEKFSYLQQIEDRKKNEDDSYKRILRTAIITARNAPSHERVVNALRQWKISVDEVFFLGGIKKERILNILKPHIYFDDQKTHLRSEGRAIPSVHIPFGVANKGK